MLKNERSVDLCWKVYLFVGLLKALQVAKHVSKNILPLCALKEFE